MDDLSCLSIAQYIVEHLSRACGIVGSYPTESQYLCCIVHVVCRIICMRIYNFTMVIEKNNHYKRYIVKKIEVNMSNDVKLRHIYIYIYKYTSIITNQS